MAVLQGRSEAEMPKGFDCRTPCLRSLEARLARDRGTVATQTADTGELDISFAMPTGERDLWNFATLTGEPRLRVRNPPCRLC
jgi:hypothetical protein